MNRVSVSALAETLIRVRVGHLVSSASMVSRAFLTDDCVGVIVDQDGYWLLSALPVLTPDPDGLRVRAFEKGRIPVDHGNPRLTKITLGWGESSVDLNNPTVVAGPCGVGAVSLAVPASLGDKIRSGEGPRPVVLGDDAELALGDEVAVVIVSDTGPLLRWARVSSDPDFAGRGVALGVGLPSELAGSPVFAVNDEAQFCGIAEPIDTTTSLLLPLSAMRTAIP